MKSDSIIVHLAPADPVYPPRLKTHLASHTAPPIASVGNVDFLRKRAIAFICSAKHSGGIILNTFDMTQRLREKGVTLIGGFHSPMEKECLRILLRGKQPIIICPARSIERMRIPTELKEPLEEGRLLFLSPFPEKERRVTKKNAVYRNRFVAALSDKVFVPHASPGGKVETLCREMISWNKPLYTLDDPSNANLIEMGAAPIRPKDVEQLMPGRTGER